jgi:hypothetical protein
VSLLSYLNKGEILAEYISKIDKKEIEIPFGVTPTKKPLERHKKNYDTFKKRVSYYYLVLRKSVSVCFKTLHPLGRRLQALPTFLLIIICT